MKLYQVQQMKLKHNIEICISFINIKQFQIRFDRNIAPVSMNYIFIKSHFRY